MKSKLKTHFGYGNMDGLITGKNLILPLHSSFLSGTTNKHENIEFMLAKGYIKYHFPFSNKEEYLQWKSDWKEVYKNVSAYLRGEKIAIRQLQRDRHSAEAYKALTNTMNLLKDSLSLDFSYSDSAGNEARHSITSDYATILLAYYKAGKAEAHRQYTNEKLKIAID